MRVLVCGVSWVVFLLSCWVVADFGIAAQISATLGKRKSFIGTPYW